jgi:hypothetical protein
MAALTAADLQLIRDEIGDGDDPSNAQLRKSYLEAGHWIPVALRVLKRRRAVAMQGGSVSQVQIPGAIGVTLGKVDLAALTAQIDRLQARYDQETGGGVAASAGRLTRRVPR